MNPAPELTLLPPPPKSVAFSAAPHPFKAASVFRELPEGMTVQEMIEVAQPDPMLLQHCHVEIDGVPLDPSKIHLIRPKAGHLVTVRVAPGKSKKKEGGGGKSPLQTVLTVAIVAASIGLMVAAPYLSPWIVVGLGVALAAAQVGVAMAFAPKPLVPGGLSPGGIGVRHQSGASGAAARVTDARDSPSSFVEGARNSANPWGTVPDVLGRHRMVPPYAAQPFTSAGGSAQFLHLLFAWTPGPVDVTDYRIGETPIGNYADYTLSTLSGSTSDDPGSFAGIYTQDTAEEVFSILLTQPIGYILRTTAPDAAEISIDLTLPQGLVAFDQVQGNRQAYSVTFNVRYRAAGSGGSYNPPSIHAASFPMEGIVVEGDHVRITIWGMQTAAIRHSINWRPPNVGQFEVSIARASADTTSTYVYDVITWTALRSFAHSTPVLFPVPLARTALRIRASDQLNGIIDTFSAVVHRRAFDWTGSAWVHQPTSSPAAMFRHVLQGPSNRRPVPDSQIDFPALQNWSVFCQNNGFECNLIVDFPTSVRELLQIVCGTGRAGLDNIDGKWSVVIDEPRGYPVQHFTPRNSKGFRAEKLFPEHAHAWRVRFNDQNHNWRTAERIIYAEGYGPHNANRFEQHDYMGVTKPEHIVHLATHQLRAMHLQPEEWSFEVDFEHLVAKRGDLVLLTHDMLLVGLASGRIKALDLGTGGEILGMTSDEALPIESFGQAYGVSVRTVGNVAVSARVARPPDVYDDRVVAFEPPLAPGTVAVGDLFGFGHFGAETVRGQIKRIKRSGDLAARVVALPYTDALWNYVLPADFDPGMTPLFDVPAPQIQTVYTGGGALGREPDATLVRVVIEVAPLWREGAQLDAQVRPTTTGEYYRGAEVVSRPQFNIIVLGGMRIGEDWDLRVRWIVGPRQPGPWGYRSGVRIQGFTAVALTQLRNLTLSAIGGQALLRWDAPVELDARFGGSVVFRHSPFQVGATWANSTSIGQGVPVRNQVVNLPLKGGTYLARVITSGGVPGAVSSVSTKQAAATPFGMLVSFEEHPDWAGAHNGTEVGIGDALQLSGIFVPVGGFGELGAVAISGVYDFAVVVDLLTVKRVRVTVHMDAASINVADTIDDREERIDAWQDFDGGADQGEGDAQVWVRITDDDPGEATEIWGDGTGWSDGTGWTDTPGGAFWKLYQRLDSAEFEARGFDFQLRLASRDPAYNVLVNELRVDFEEVVAPA